VNAHSRLGVRYYLRNDHDLRRELDIWEVGYLWNEGRFPIADNNARNARPLVHGNVLSIERDRKDATCLSHRCAAKRRPHISGPWKRSVDRKRSEGCHLPIAPLRSEATSTHLWSMETFCRSKEIGRMPPAYRTAAQGTIALACTRRHAASPDADRLPRRLLRSRAAIAARRPAVAAR